MARVSEHVDGVRVRPGGRSARIRDSALSATVALLLEKGYGAFTVADVAAGSGASEATIYRRWGGLTNLVADAVEEFVLDENPIPDTGVLEDDLRQLLRAVIALIERPEILRLLRSITSLTSENEAATEARRAFWRDRFDRGATMVRRAIDRGEVPVDTEPREVIETLVGAAYVRAFLTELPLTDSLIDGSVRAALAMCHGRGEQPSPLSRLID